MLIKKTMRWTYEFRISSWQSAGQREGVGRPACSEIYYVFYIITGNRFAAVMLSSV